MHYRTYSQYHIVREKRCVILEHSRPLRLGGGGGGGARSPRPPRSGAVNFLYGAVMSDPSGQPYIWESLYGTHAEPGCTPHMGGPYGTHIHVCMLAG